MVHACGVEKFRYEAPELGMPLLMFGRQVAEWSGFVEWADDPDVPIPYTLDPRIASCLHAASWTLNEYAEHLVTCGRRHRDLR